MVIYGGDSESEENQVNVKFSTDHESQGKKHLAMVLQKFDWNKCLAVAILAKMNGKPVVAIVDTGSVGVVILESCFEIPGLKRTMRLNIPSPPPLIPIRNSEKFF